MLRILLVEDHADLREALAILLEAPGREICACGTARQALEAFARQRFDVVVCDVNLPDGSGIELARRLHAIDASTWIALSSGAGVDVSRIGTDERVRFLAKPFPVDALEALIAEFGNAAPKV